MTERPRPTKSIDFHAVVQDLRAAEMPEKQAVAVANALRESRDFDLSTFSTKADLLATQVNLEQELSGLRVELYKIFIAQTFVLLTSFGLIVGFLR